MNFRMKDSVFAGDRMVFRGVVEKVETDATGCSWVDVALSLKVGEQLVTSCAARVAIPANASDNPWKRRGENWKP